MNMSRKLLVLFLAWTAALVLAPRAQVLFTGSIGDTVFLDFNANNLPNAGEGAPGVTLTLYDATGVNALATTVTDAGGQYLFAGLATGTYVVVVATNTLPGTPGQWTNTYDPDGGILNRSTVTLSNSPGNGSSSVNLGSAANFAVLAGSTATSTGNTWIEDGDLGLSPGSAVTGFPPGLVSPGAIHISDALAIQAQVDLVTAYNDVAGRGVSATVAAELGGSTRTPGVYNSADTTFGITGTLTLDAQGDANAVFIFQAGSTLTTAGNSKVVLLNGAQAGNVFWQVGSSATLGTYSTFRGNILALTSITLTTGAGVEGRVLARNGAVTMDNNHIWLPRRAGTDNLDQDFGYQAANPNAISGTLWEDLNADGLLGVSESVRFIGVTVALLGPNGPVLATTVTDAGGNYSFANLPDGSYLVDVTDSGNVLAVYGHSIGPSPGADNNSQTDPYSVAVSGGVTNSTGDFGYYYNGEGRDELAALGDLVWNDVNANGIQDAGELGVSGVVVTLYNGASTPVRTTTTAVGGLYGFTHLVPGVYHVGFAIPASSAASPQDQGGDDAKDSDANVATGQTIPTTLVAGENDTTWDLGLRRVLPQLAVIGNVEAFLRDGQAVVRWETIESWGTAGFWLERRIGNEWVRISQELIPFPLFGAPPLVYEEEDAGVAAGGTYFWRLVELENSGNQLVYGPYQLTVDGPGRTYADWAAGHFTAAEQAEAAISGQHADADGDGLTNGQEFLAWTDPKNADSVLQIRSVKKTGDGFELGWDSVPGRFYRIALSDRVAGPFLPLAEPILATDGHGTAKLSVNFQDRQMYFHVILVGGAAGE